jgi:hypothetical protein
MLKLQIAWTLDTGETYEEWTIPFELALAEKEIYNGKPITTALRDAESPSNNLLLFLAHKIQKRVTQKPVLAFDVWATKVTDVQFKDLDHPKVTGQAQ